MGACSDVATCVWPAYDLRPSHFDCLRREGIQLTCMNGIRASTLAFLSGGRAVQSPPRGGQTVCPCEYKDDLWWTDSPRYGDPLVEVVNLGGTKNWWPIGRWIKQPYTRN